MSETRVCRFTSEGLSAAKGCLQMLRDNHLQRPFPGLLSDPAYVEPVEPEAYVESRPFADRREAGQYLGERLASIAEAGLATDPAMWSWLGMFFLDEMHRQDAATSRRIGEFTEATYLIDPATHDSRDKSHHRLLIAYDVWTRHGEDAWLLLNDPASSMSQFTLRLVQSPEVFRSRGIVKLAHMLYADRGTGRLREGARGMSRATAPPGSLPRLFVVLQALSLTYDVYGMTAEQLLPLLPAEFDRFRPAAA